MKRKWCDTNVVGENPTAAVGVRCSLRPSFFFFFAKKTYTIMKGDVKNEI